MKHFLGGLAVGLAGWAGYMVLAPGQRAAPDVVPTQDAIAALTAPAGATPAPEPQQADADDWAAVRATRDPSAVAMYLSQHPDGPNRDAAMAFLNELLVPDDRASVTRGIAAPLAPAQAASAGPDFSDASMWAEGAAPVTGFRASDLDTVLTLMPSYPPLEGLPAAAWQGKACADCHSLTVTELCGHSELYNTANFDFDAGTQHPLGASFKKMLAGWAEQGCP